MTKVGILSDTHIPDRTSTLPEGVITTFIQHEVELILHAGDVTSEEVLNMLGEIAPVRVVRGNMDWLEGLPLLDTLNIGSFRVCLFHGSGIFPRGETEPLLYIAKHENCDVLITGHTHSPRIVENDGTWIVNPGSPTVPQISNPTLIVGEIDSEVKLSVVQI